MTRELGEPEDTVMTRLWGANAPMAVQVQDALRAEGRTLAYTTVATVRDNLHTKGWVTRTLSCRAFHYTGVGSRDEYTAGLTKQAWERSGDTTACFAALLSGMTQQQRTAMEAALRIVRSSPQGTPPAQETGGAAQ
ncbi:BlaI/MecI/CopY family transcriptional regulator [Streptomyces sp. ISL-10]|uniref:BlaI/MecI/CopY family transcriptional regulator n=1 Tax=Streptomyces sp. ISL-10 TaxID=2819172 RepID=UPI001BEC3419|nr:BlaI/MecI/CopY family transcriptional regulator [Streptomyces sp. ISL-10]MBT2369168.1 BlaI/MecI/CopY family transcriptional regulator [Streptomyces sp. ISL-10]